MFRAFERAKVRCDKIVTDFESPANDKHACPSPGPDTSNTKQENSWQLE